MRSRGLLVAASCAAVAAAISCGSSRPAPIGGSSSSSSSSSSGEPIFCDGKPKFTCADIKGPDGGTCECQEQDLLTDPPNVYFVLDRSGSMVTDDKWSTIRVVVADVIRALGQRINVGIMVYPNSNNGDTCAAGVQRLALRQGDPPSKDGRDGPTTEAVIAAMNLAPGGGTPTAATLEAAGSVLKAAKGKTFVVLATDGAPNCADTACDTATCSLNIEGLLPGCTPTGANCCTGQNVHGCVDGSGTDAAVKRLKLDGVSTFVIGVPGTAPYADLLDRLAQSGGTARPQKPYYYRVDSASTADFTSALKKVAAQILATCTFTLKTAAKADEVNVYLDGNLVPQNEQNGWTVSDKTVTLTGDACRRVLEGDVIDVRIVSGCPTVIK